MKYFQALGRIEYRYQDILYYIDDPGYGHRLLESWGINPSEKEAILEEMELLRYLLGLQVMLVRDSNAKKPTQELVKRCFDRYLRFLERVHKCDAYNVNKHRSVFVRKEYKACRHYLFQFSLPAWYAKLPDEILTFENKYPDF